MTLTVERGGRVVRGQNGDATRPRRPRTSYALYLLPGFVAFLAVIVVPFLMNIGSSFTDWQGVGSPDWSGLANYRELMDDSEFWASFRHSLFMVVAMAVVPTALGLVLAAALFDFVAKHFGTRTAAVLRACFYLPQVLPIAVAGIVWSWILRARQRLAERPAQGRRPRLLAAGLAGRPGPRALQRHGRDGVGADRLPARRSSWRACSGWTRSCTRRPSWTAPAGGGGSGTITLPQIRPEISVVLLWCTIAALKVFGAVYVLTKGGPGGATDVPSYFSFTTFFEKTQVGYGSAISTVLTVIILAPGAARADASRPATRTPRRDEGSAV